MTNVPLVEKLKRKWTPVNANAGFDSNRKVLATECSDIMRESGCTVLAQAHIQPVAADDGAIATDCFSTAFRKKKIPTEQA